MDAQHTARQAYQLECKADIELSRITGRLNALYAEQSKWRELRRVAICLQDNINHGPELFPEAPAELDDALDALGLSRAAMSYVPMVSPC